MPPKNPATPEATSNPLAALGVALRARRKALGLSAVATAEAAGLSRVTLHRIEKGEPSVTMGAWHNVIRAVGMQLQLTHDGPSPPHQALPPEGWWPVRIPIENYPQLKALAWQVQGTDHLTPVEAHSIYERNERHLDWATMSAEEHKLIQALQAAFVHKAQDV